VSNLLGAQEILALLERLRQIVKDFADRDEKLDLDLRARKTAEIRAHEFNSKQSATQSAESLAALEKSLEDAKVQARENAERRRLRINEAHKTVRKRVLEQVNEQEGRRKYKLQEASLQAERRKTSNLAEAAAEREATYKAVAESQAAFADLDNKVRSAFSGSGQFKRLLAPTVTWPEPDFSPDEHALLNKLHELHAAITADVSRFRRRIMPAISRFFPSWLAASLIILVGALTPFAERFGLPPVPLDLAIKGLGGLLVFVLTVYFAGNRAARHAAKDIARRMAQARRWHDACFEKADQTLHRRQLEIQDEFTKATREFEEDWKRNAREAIEQRGSKPAAVDEQAARVTRKAKELAEARLANLETRQVTDLEQARKAVQDQTKQNADAHAQRLKRIEEDGEAQWRALEQEWSSLIEPIYEAVSASNVAVADLSPEWDSKAWDNWTPPAEFKNAAKVGGAQVNLAKLAGSAPKHPSLALADAGILSAALCLKFPQNGSILIETGKAGSQDAFPAINNIIFRLLATTPPGKLSFTIFDPVGLGQNFAGLMHLADFEESNINSRIWTQTAQLEEKLADLNEHMEKVIQMYLRNEYETIADYNRQAGTIAEKYHFLVIADFPVNFSDTALRRLLNIANSGARCGVYVLIHWDQRNPPPQNFVPDELRKSSLCLVGTGQGFEVRDRPMPGSKLFLDAPPSPEFVTRFLRNVGQSGKDSNRVEVPFSEVAPPSTEMWTEDSSDELRVPIGRSGATRLQYLAVGKGTRQHALIAGKTGSGKSTLFHVIITNLALRCSPEQVEFYLVDFKKGVEFKCYGSRRLPHARVVAIESDRQFGLSVLEKVDAELRRRGDLFRKAGVQDLPGYRRSPGAEPMPRSLLMIDEFQEFFVEEDRISQGAAVLLDRIVRQGRAFGIHVLLGSQTLGGAYTLARATIGQMVVRIALQCNEADAYLIMDQDNAAPRLLSRPGEGIYNDAAGSIEGNSPFQAVWLPEEERDSRLADVRDRADRNGSNYPGPFVFEGNAPADVRENQVLEALLKADSIKPSPFSRTWLGSPNSIKGPTEAVFRRQGGSNLIIVGQNEEASLTMLSVALIALSSQFPRGGARFVLFDALPPGTPPRDFLDRIVKSIPHQVLLARDSETAQLMSSLAEGLGEGAPSAANQNPETFLLIHGLHNFKKLKQADEFSFSSGDSEEANIPAIFSRIITEGPAAGFHVLASCDSGNSVSRFLGRKLLSEFEMRVLFQMSASDSAALIDAPDAGTLGLHRALLYNDREGYLETFRPYAPPASEWLEQAAHELKRLIP
jgi:hypothetical protein